MDTARIFPSGRSQEFRLPKEYRFKGKDVMNQTFREWGVTVAD
ncbi:MAG: antitoxin [Chlorobium sp.]